MGTRSITTVRSRWEGKEEWRTNATVYRHWDGYLDGHGEWLHDFLDGLEIINGIPGDPPPRFANGPGRLAAQMVAKLQDDGHVPDLVPDDGPRGQEYHYQIDIEYGGDGGRATIAVFDGPMTAFGDGGENCTNQVFAGSVSEFGLFLKAETAEPA